MFCRRPAMGTGVRQCTAADRKRICELQLTHKDLTQEKLTTMIADQLKLPNIKRPTVTGILEESHKWLNSADTTADKRSLECETENHCIKTWRLFSCSGLVSSEPEAL